MNRPGDRFRCTLDEDLVVNGSVLAPTGTDCFGRVVQFKQNTGELQNQPAPDQPAMSQSGVAGLGQYGTSQSQFPTLGQTDLTGQTGMTAVNQNLGLILTEIDVNGQRFMLGGTDQATLSTTQTGNMGAQESASLSVVDFNHGAPATSVISSAPSATGANMGAGIGLGAGAANQVVINGSHLNVPSQTVLEFRLQDPQTLTPSGSSSMQTP